MKLKINKACDLNSISVLPPHIRRSAGVCAGPSTSVLGGGIGGQASASQQSFSQGVSSQQDITLSQFSQSSLDELVINDQRFRSQERETSVKRISCPAPGPYTREDSQVPLSRSSTNLMCRWSSTSAPNHKCMNQMIRTKKSVHAMEYLSNIIDKRIIFQAQASAFGEGRYIIRDCPKNIPTYALTGQINEELERRIALIETSLTRFGMILDSIQSDVMQINKGTKEISLEAEGIRQKSSIQDDSLHVLSRGQEDIRDSLDAGIKLLTDQINKSTSENKFQESLAIVSALPEQIEVCLWKLKDELFKSLSEELQALISSLRASVVSNSAPPILLPKVTDSSSHKAHKIEPVPLKFVEPSPFTASAKVEMGSWNCVKGGQDSVKNKNSCNPVKQRTFAPIQQIPTSANVSDEDLDADFSCLLVGQQTDIDNDLIKEAKEQTEHILRKARRKKRRQCNTIIID